MRAAVSIFNLELPDVLFLLNTDDAPVCNREQAMSREYCRCCYVFAALLLYVIYLTRGLAVVLGLRCYETALASPDATAVAAEIAPPLIQSLRQPEEVHDRATRSTKLIC
jgi:hypothetical protein